jgi:sugar-specific transcriptional regulator TrmB
LKKEVTPKEIWKNSEIPREEVYRKLEELQELDFVEKILATPRLFRAVPLKTVLKELLRKKAEELSQLQSDSEELILSNINTGSTDILENPFKTIIVPKKRAHITKAKKEMLKLKKSLECVLSWEKGIGWFNAHFEIFEDLMKRNVKIRWVIERRENSDFMKQVKELPNHHLFEVKEVSKSPGACLGIYDRKVVLIDTSATSAFIQTPMLWSSNPSLIVLAQNYFDMLWNNV